MSITVLFNGATYTIPETGEESWGSNLTSYFTAIPQGALQKTGGSFTLTADTNFGANFGLLSKYYSTRATNPATAGLVRLSVADTIAWRNNANSANLLLAVNGSDQLTFNGATVIGVGSITAGTFDSATPSANGLDITGTTAVTITLQSATNTEPGLVNNTIQNFSGNKIFANVINVPQINIDGASTGSVRIKVQPNAGTFNFNLPTTAGTAGFLLASDGGGTGTGQTWVNPKTFTSSFIFQPGGTASGNVYTTWASLYAALPTNLTFVKIIFDTSFAACNIPAGSYAFNNVAFECPLDLPGGFVSVGLDDGCVFTSFPYIGYGVQITNNSTTAVYTVSGSVTVNVGPSALLQSTSTGTFIDVLSGANLQVNVGENSVLLGAGNPLITAHGTGNIGITLGNSAVVSANGMVGDAGSGLTIIINSTTSGFDATQASFAGTIQTYQSTYFYGQTSSQIVQISAAPTTAAYALVLPALQGGASTTLVNDGAGNLSWGTTGSTSPLTTKGDLYTYSTVNARLPVGSNGYVLSANSAQTTGLEWIANSSSGTPTPTALTNAQWDASINFSANSFIPGFFSQATANSTKTMVITDAETQEFTGSTAGQIVKLPTTGVTAGKPYTFLNNSTQIVTVQSSGANTIQAMAAGTELVVTALVATPTTAANWSANYQGLANGGSSSLSVPNVTDSTAYTPTFSAGWGTVSSSNVFYQRFGDSIRIYGTFTIGTTAASAGTISLPGGLAIDTTKTNVAANKIYQAGTIHRITNSSNAVNILYKGLAVDTGSNTTVFMADTTASNAYVATTVSSVFNSGEYVSFDFTVPISGWTATSPVVIVGSAGGGQSSINLPNMTAWSTALSLTPNSFGSVTSATYNTRQVGDTLETNFYFVPGSAAAATASLSLPAGLLADSTKLPTQGAWIGFWNTNGGPSTWGGAVSGPIFYDGSDTGKVYLAYQTSSTQFAKVNANSISNGGLIEGFFRIPIASYTATSAVTLVGTTGGNQSANTVYAGPTSGGASPPTFRSLVAADLPALSNQQSVVSVNGYGSSSTVILRWTTNSVSLGSSITYTDSATLGGLFTVNATGVYTISGAIRSTSNNYISVGRNLSGSQLTTNPNGGVSTTGNNGFICVVTQAAGTPNPFSWTGNLTAADVISIAMDSGASFSTAWMTITRIV